MVSTKKCKQEKQCLKLIIIRTIMNMSTLNNWATNQHIKKMISEGSCDTEDWSNAAE